MPYIKVCYGRENYNNITMESLMPFALTSKNIMISSCLRHLGRGALETMQTWAPLSSKVAPSGENPLAMVLTTPSVGRLSTSGYMATNDWWPVVFHVLGVVIIGPQEALIDQGLDLLL